MDAQKMKEQQDAVCASEVRRGVLGNGSEFLFLTLPDYDQPIADAAFARGFRYVGALGWTGGTLAIHVEDEPSAPLSMMRATAAFVKEMAAPPCRSAMSSECGDSLAWLERLYSLPDYRI